MARPKNKPCAICGIVCERITMDHIPFDGIFPDPKPQDPITVPACKECNEKTSLDEEYFRAVITPGSFHSNSAKELVDQKIIKGFRQKPALLRSIMKNTKKVDVYSQGGIYMGEQPAIQYEPQRIKNVIEKIVRGLFWYEKGEPLGSNYIVERFTLNPPYDNKTKAGIASLPLKKVGDGEVFSYRVLMDKENPRIGCWFLMFFNEILFVSITESAEG